MEKALVTAGILVVPTILLILGFKLSGRKVEWVPLLWAGFACLVYVLLLRSRTMIPVPGFLEEPALNWFGKFMSFSGTIAMLYLLPRVGFRAAGLTWTQNKGSLRPIIRTGSFILLAAAGVSGLIAYSPNTSLENLLFQATMPGLDEELFFHGLLLLLLHQAFGKGLKVWDADTGWGFWLIVAIFGLLHGVTVNGGELEVSLWQIVSTGFTGLVLIWMRERTGSLVVPVLYHNVFNIAQALV